MKPHSFRRLAIACLCSAGVTACSSPLLPEPYSDSNYDDPDAPSTGGTTAPPPAIPDGGNLAVYVDENDAGQSAPVAFTDLRFISGANSLVFAAGGCTGGVSVLATTLRTATPLAIENTVDNGKTSCITSADPSSPSGDALLAAVDSTTNTLSIVNLGNSSVASYADLAATPAFARVVGTSTVWVTEPAAGNIEVFAIGGSLKSVTKSTTITVGSGTTGLSVDDSHATAYTNSTAGVMAIDTTTNALVGTWATGCQTAGGVVADPGDNWVFAGCGEGAVVVLDAAHDGANLGSLTVSPGAESIAFDPITRHLYITNGASGMATVASVDSAGTLSLLGTFLTAQGAACITTDEERTIFVCDPARGAILLHIDQF